MLRYFGGICTVLLCGTITSAATIGTANLTASQDLDPVTMTPPVSTATGTFSLSVNPTGDMLTYDLTFSGLTSDVIMGHIHYGPPGVSGAVLFPLFDYGMPPSVTTTAETVSGTLTVANFQPDSADGIGTFAAALAAIEAGNTYVNVHTLNYPAGEIRGQITVSGGLATAPEPASVTLFIAGAFLLFTGLWSRRIQSH